MFPYLHDANIFATIHGYLNDMSIVDVSVEIKEIHRSVLGI